MGLPSLPPIDDNENKDVAKSLPKNIALPPDFDDSDDDDFSFEEEWVESQSIEEEKQSLVQDENIITKELESSNAKLTKEEKNNGWVIDKKTGLKYKRINKQKFGGTKKNPIPIADPEVLKEIDDPYDINDAADKFLAHLKVAPDEKEIQRIREEKAKQRREKNIKYEEESRSYMESNDSI